jgi:Fur family ferric uptake transcriptional regulator
LVTIPHRFETCGAGAEGVAAAGATVAAASAAAIIPVTASVRTAASLPSSWGYPRCVGKTRADSWTEYALRTLARAGYRSSEPRQTVIEAVASRGCSVSARDIADELRDEGSGIGLASIYRTLELLDKMKLVQRFDVGEGVARYEPAHASGEHHHHLVCDSCGNVTAFEDSDLEHAIERLSHRVDFDIDAHDVTLHGECPACRP